MTNREAIAEFEKRITLIEKDGYVDLATEFTEAMKMAISALEKQQWIPCSQRLPKKDCECRVTDNDVDHAQGTDGREVVQILSDIPAADVVPVVHGKWLPIVSYNNTYKCSECGRLLVDITDGLKMVAKHYPYCHCGAKMDAQKEG